MDPRKRVRAASAATQQVPQQEAPEPVSRPVPAAVHAAHNVPSGAVLASQPPADAGAEPSDPRQRHKRARHGSHASGSGNMPPSVPAAAAQSSGNAPQRTTRTAERKPAAAPAGRPVRPSAAVPPNAQAKAARVPHKIDVHPMDLEAGHPYLQPQHELFELRNVTFIPPSGTLLECEAAFVKPQNGNVESTIALIGVSIQLSLSQMNPAHAQPPS